MVHGRRCDAIKQQCGMLSSVSSGAARFAGFFDGEQVRWWWKCKLAGEADENPGKIAAERRRVVAWFGVGKVYSREAL
jgi:hypothetical protein